MLLKELKIPLQSMPIIWCDNLSAIALASNPVFHAHTKHIELNCHFIRENVLQKLVSVHHITSVDQIVDVFTKALSAVKNTFFRSKLKVLPILNLREVVRERDLNGIS